MNEIYKKLNDYLNDICAYLEVNHPFLLEKIDKIAKLNDTFLQFINNYSLDYKTIENKLTYEDVYNLAREIIASIDVTYLERFDNLIQSGELDFSYEGAYDDSTCASLIKNGEVVRQLININRTFTYDDVRVLIHEFIHYTHVKKINSNILSFSEFLSIYFEIYALDYLKEKGINEEELNYMFRIKSTRRHSTILFQYEIILLAYTKFGNLAENTVTLIQKYFFGIKGEVFEKECLRLYKNLCIAENKKSTEIKENPHEIGLYLAEEFIGHNYRYVLGTLLAIYARKYLNFKDIVHLNNHINEFDYKTIKEICLGIGIDLEDKNFIPKLFNSIGEYLKEHQSILKSPHNLK